ncbi:hypothetical protein SGLAM104S_08460 [Streptomyces glaucescens]
MVGAVVGIAAYSISQTGGQLLSVVVGGVIGVALVLGADVYRKSVQLTEVRLILPGSEMTFQTNTDMRQAALRMFFQAATRVATRPLDDGSGNLREALTSLKALFDMYREPLESGNAPPPPAHGDSVHELVLDILNFELAPFLASAAARLRGGPSRRGRVGLARERRVPAGPAGTAEQSAAVHHRARRDRGHPRPRTSPAQIRLACRAPHGRRPRSERGAALHDRVTAPRRRRTPVLRGAAQPDPPGRLRVTTGQAGKDRIPSAGRGRCEAA